MRRRRAVTLASSLAVLAGIVVACNAVTHSGPRAGATTSTTRRGSATSSSSTVATLPATTTTPTTTTTTTTSVPTSFNVGIHTFYWDETGPGVTHVGPTGAPLPGRVLTTQVRYPTLAGSPGTQAPNAEPATVGGPYPVIVFAHGFMNSPANYAGLLDTWVEAGFVVVSPIFPDESLQAVTAAGGMSNTAIADALEDDVYNEPGDIVYVLKQLQSLALQPWGSHLRGVLNLSDVGLAGQSDGANVVAALAYASGLASLYASLPSVPKAVAVLSGYAWSDLPHGEIGSYGATAGSPALLQVQSDADGCVSPASAADLFSSLQGGLTSKWFVTLLGAGHLGPYEGAAPWAAVVDAVTTKFFELELDWRTSSSSASAIEAAATLNGAAQVTTAVSESTMPQVPVIPGC